jgi:hypothetical protein
MDDSDVCHGRIVAISILDPLDVQEAYSHIASHYHSVKRHVRSHEWGDAIIGQEEYSIEEKLVFCCEVSSTDAFQMLQ